MIRTLDWFSSKQKVAMILCLAGIMIALISFFIKQVGLSSAMDEKIFTVGSESIELNVNLVGELVPASRVMITYPFSGEISEIFVAVGQSVKIGDALLRIDTSDLDSLLRNAEIALLTAKEKFQDLSDWDNSEEVVTARRNLADAEQNLKRIQKKAQETRALYEKGIIARSEYEEDKFSLQTQLRSVFDEKVNLERVLTKGAGSALRIASLELENAQQSYSELTRLREEALVKANINGVIQLVPQQRSFDPQNPAPIVGQKLTSGDPLYVIEQSDTLNIITYVTENDLSKLSVGQIASVSSQSNPDLELTATISKISGHAVDAERWETGPKFKVEATLDNVAETSEETLRVGSKVFMYFTSKLADEIILVPPNALSFKDDKVYVSALSGNNGYESRFVEIGRSVNGNIEILSGIDDGDRIKLR